MVYLTTEGYWLPTKTTLSRYVYVQIQPRGWSCLHPRTWSPDCWNNLGRGRKRRSHCHFHTSQGYVTIDTVTSSRTVRNKNKKIQDPKTFTLLNSYPKTQPHPSLLKYFCLSSVTGVSLKGYRQNWEGSTPCEKKVNQLFNTNCKEWHFNQLMKHLCLQKVVL
jgi:hypothetical protein